MPVLHEPATVFAKLNPCIELLDEEYFRCKVCNKSIQLRGSTSRAMKLHLDTPTHERIAAGSFYGKGYISTSCFNRFATTDHEFEIIPESYSKKVTEKVKISMKATKK